MTKPNSTEDNITEKKEYTKGSAKPRGWFSRRHQTSTEHYAVKEARYAKQDAKLANVEIRQIAASERTPRQQLNRLDKRLGKGLGAESERARLNAKIKEQAAAKKKTA